jgi:hypothetical protein
VVFIVLGSVTIPAVLFAVAPLLVGVMLAAVYVPGFYLFVPVFDALPYKGWLVSVVHITCAVTVQNLVMWALVRFVPKKSKYGEQSRR